MTIAYYLVTGRICGDDEDTALTFESDCDDIDEVRRMFTQELRGMYSDPECPDYEPEVFVNHVCVSATPIAIAVSVFRR